MTDTVALGMAAGSLLISAGGLLVSCKAYRQGRRGQWLAERSTQAAEKAQALAKRGYELAQQGHELAKQGFDRDAPNLDWKVIAERDGLGHMSHFSVIVRNSGKVGTTLDRLVTVSFSSTQEWVTGSSWATIIYLPADTELQVEPFNSVHIQVPFKPHGWPEADKARTYGQVEMRAADGTTLTSPWLELPFIPHQRPQAD
jgi:hypothetical protein